MKKFDDQVLIDFLFYLTDDVFLDARIAECLNEDRKAEAKANVVVKERIVADIEKRRSRLAKRLEEEDDAELGARYRELGRELAVARNEVSVAEAAVSDIPAVDVREMKRQIRGDMAHFAEKPIAEQKALLAKYCTKITGMNNPVTEAYKPRFEFRVSAPVVREPEWEPIEMNPVPPRDGNAIRVKYAATEPRRRCSKSEIPCNSASMPRP